MKKLYKFLTIIGVSLIMTSCYYDAYVENPDDNGGPIIPPTDISFKNDVQPLFIKCAGCHGGATDPDLRADNAYNALVPQYVTIGDGANSELVNKLPGNGHPIDAGFTLSAAEIATITAWIDEGAKNN